MGAEARAIRRASERVPAPMTIALTGLTTLAVAMGVGRFAFTPILPMMQEDAGLTVAEGGWLAAANYLGYLVGALSAVVVRVPTTAAIRHGLIVICLTTLGMGFSHHFVLWVALRAVAGVASAWVLISISSWCLERLAPLRRPLLTGAVFAGVGLGIMAAGLSCLAVMYTQAGSARAWVSLGMLSLAVTAVIWRRVGSEDDAASVVKGPAPRRRHRWDAESAILVVCYGAFGFGYIIPATFVPAMAHEAIRDPWIFGWAWPVFGAAAAASTFVAALASRAGGNRRLWMLGHLVMACAVALPVLVSGMSGIILAAVGVGGTFMVNTMAGMQEARQVAGPQATGLMAAMTSAFAVGQIGGPLFVSYVAASDGFRHALLVASALLAASALLLWRYRAA
jgi:predicted MFS family arabinose efflux permease